MKSLPYYDDLTARQTIKLRELIKTLPPFAKEFFRAIDSTTQVRTRIAYAYDLRVFFHFLIDENPAYRNYSVLDFKVSDLDKIESVDLEEYMEYLKDMCLKAFEHQAYPFNEIVNNLNIS